MLTEKVIISRIHITKAGQVKYFQIRLPKDTICIIGIETGGRLLSATKKPESGGSTGGASGIGGAGSGADTIGRGSIFSLLGMSTAKGKGGLPFYRNTLIGELKLQSCEKANIFYSGHVLTDENIGARDYSQRLKWKAKAYTHECKSEEDLVIVKGDSTLIQGFYKDRLGEMRKEDTSYILQVYIWIKIPACPELTQQKGEAS